MGGGDAKRGSDGRDGKRATAVVGGSARFQGHERRRKGGAVHQRPRRSGTGPHRATVRSRPAEPCVGVHRDGLLLDSVTRGGEPRASSCRAPPQLATGAAQSRRNEKRMRHASNWQPVLTATDSVFGLTIAVFPILADVVEVKTGSGSTAHWSIHFIRLNGWLRHCFAQLITLLDIDGIGQNWEDSNT